MVRFTKVLVLIRLKSVTVNNMEKVTIKQFSYYEFRLSSVFMLSVAAPGIIQGRSLL